MCFHLSDKFRALNFLIIFILMIRPGLIVFFLVPFLGLNQQIRLKYVNDSHSLSLIIVDGVRYDLDYSHNFYNGGTTDFQSGKAKTCGNRLILTSSTEKETDFYRMVLKKKTSKNEKHSYFIDLENHTLWKVKSVKNKEFKRRMFSNATEGWMNKFNCVK